MRLTIDFHFALGPEPKSEQPHQDTTLDSLVETRDDMPSHRNRTFGFGRPEAERTES